MKIKRNIAIGLGAIMIAGISIVGVSQISANAQNKAATNNNNKQNLFMSNNFITKIAMIVISKAYRPVFYILLQKANWYYMLILSFLSMLSRMPICPLSKKTIIFVSRRY